MPSYPGTRLGFALVAIALLIPGQSGAQQEGPPRLKIRAVDVKKFAKLTYDLAEKVDLIDELTEAKSKTEIVRSGNTKAESTSLVMTYRVSDIELSKSLTNRIWLLGDVPGRTVSTSIKVDCLVHEWYTVPIKIRSGANRDALLIKLAPSRHQVEFDGDALVRNELGPLRLNFLGDDNKAKKLREELYADAQDLAMKRFRERAIPESDEVADTLKAEVQAANPTKPVRVTRDESGLTIEIGQYFPANAEDSPIPVARVAAALVLLLVVVAALVFLRLQARRDP